MSKVNERAEKSQKTRRLVFVVCVCVCVCVSHTVFGERGRGR